MHRSVVFKPAETCGDWDEVEIYESDRARTDAHVGGQMELTSPVDEQAGALCIPMMPRPKAASRRRERG